MREYHVDLHIHTVLSACAEVEMIPPLIVEEALYKGLHAIAITDHNATGNVAAVMEAAAETELVVLPGMELLTQEEVDVLCLFDTLEQAQTWQTQVDGWLLPLNNDAEHFGPQFLVNAAGEFVAEDTRMRKAPARVGIEEAARAVHALGGLVIPAHVERDVYGLMYVLGFWPPELEADAAEVSHNLRPSQAYIQYPSLRDIPIISASDAHFLDWIGNTRTVFRLGATPSVSTLRSALRQGAGQGFYVP
ncbi:MAG TPA: PHP-associated domain-containing protein [Anaerolineae bacterium]|nr:PHP-associated domain-containing protein [Anaerolineae bacterium]HQH37714.1 PHP-associated domain-containing protein [Anaerolineae bacterium]